jgi:hypothetical protein
MSKDGDITTLEGMTPEEALIRGLVSVPPADVDRVMAMTPEERLEWARGQLVSTPLPNGSELVQPVGPLMERGLERRREKNRARRRRQGRH